MQKKTTTWLAVIVSSFLSAHAYGVVYHEKQWSVATFTGPLSLGSAWRYYVEPQLRLINDPYVFNQSFLLGGVGYQFSPAIAFYTGVGWIFGKNTQGQDYNEYRLWQQLNWQMWKVVQTTFDSRTRLEEKARTDQSDNRVDLRQRFWLRIPIRHTHYYYSLFDEVFFNINPPSWGNNYFFYQNRAFLGIGKRLSKKTFLDCGYLNQYQLGDPHQMSNVLLLSVIFQG